MHLIKGKVFEEKNTNNFSELNKDFLKCRLNVFNITKQEIGGREGGGTST